jgi:hypothetical protein
LVGSELLDRGLSRPLFLLEENEQLNHVGIAALVKLADHVGTDLGCGSEDAEEVTPRATGEVTELVNRVHAPEA